MKRIFQWERFLDWNGLTTQEKLTVKRLFFVPLIAYLLIAFINQYSLSIIILILGYLAYRNFDKSKPHK